jgi:hypothetical protein
MTPNFALTPPSPAVLAPLCLVVFLFRGNSGIKTPLPSLGAMQCGRVSRPYNCIKTEGLGVRARDFGIKCGSCQAKGDRTAGGLLINFLKWDELFLEILQSRQPDVCSAVPQLRTFQMFFRRQVLRDLMMGCNGNHRKLSTNWRSH